MTCHNVSDMSFSHVTSTFIMMCPKLISITVLHRQHRDAGISEEDYFNENALMVSIPAQR